MKTLLRVGAMASTIALLAIAGATPGSAQGYGGNKCPNGYGNCDQGAQNPDQGSDQGTTMKRRPADNGDQNDQNGPQMGQNDTHWKFDPNSQERRHHRDAKFRFEFNGYWYPEPYWSQSYGYGVYGAGRLSCRQGGALVSDRGFYRVRPIDCVGRTYTYLGRRHGDAFQITISSRSGRIVAVVAMQ